MLALVPPNEPVILGGAALAGIFAFSESAHAKIVYTRDDRWLQLGDFSGGSNRCRRSNTLPLDLNHDGTRDFTLCSWAAKSSAALSVLPGLPHRHSRPKNMIAQVRNCWETLQGGTRCGYVPAPLKYGAKIGGKEKWAQDRSIRNCRWYETTQSPFMSCAGAWSLNKGEDAYLGFKFQIKGKTHYGWEHAVIAYNGSTSELHSVGYAYESIPNKPILAGKTKGSDVIIPPPPTLRHLARGASAIPSWRARETK